MPKNATTRHARNHRIWSGLAVMLGVFYLSPNERHYIDTVTAFLGDVGIEPLAGIFNRLGVALKYTFLAGLLGPLALQLILGLVLLLLGVTGMVSDSPGYFFSTLSRIGSVSLFEGDRRKRETDLANHCRTRLSGVYSSSPDPAYLVAGVVNWMVKSLIILLVFLVGVSYAVVTYARLSQASIASNIVKEKLRVALVAAQLGDVPLDVRTQLVDIAALRSEMKPLRTECALLGPTLDNIRMLGARPGPKDLTYQTMHLRAAAVQSARRTIDNDDVEGMPSAARIARADQFYYLAYLCSAGYVALCEIEQHGSVSEPFPSDTNAIVEHCRNFDSRAQSETGLASVVNRVETLHNSLGIMKKNTWLANPKSISDIEIVAARFFEDVPTQQTTQDFVRSQFNGYFLRVLLFRVVSIEAVADSSFQQYRRMAAARLRTPIENDGAEFYAAKIFREFVEMSGRAKEYFPNNGLVSISRAEAYECVFRYLRTFTAATGAKPMSEAEFELLRAIGRDLSLAGNSVPSKDLYIASHTRFQQSLAVSLRAEAIAALDEAGEAWDQVWKCVDNPQDFCDGLFDEYVQPVHEASVKRAFEVAGVEWPFGSISAGRRSGR